MGEKRSILRGTSEEESQNSEIAPKVSEPAIPFVEMSSKPSSNVWDFKPWWCQPPSILTSGLSSIAGVYAVTHGSWLFTGIVVLIVMLWWYTFLIVYPAEFRSSIERSNWTQNDES